MKNIFVLPLIILMFQFSHAQKKPNIVLFVADDLGATDMSLYGNPNRT